MLPDQLLSGPVSFIFIYFHLFSSLPGKGERSDTRQAPAEPKPQAQEGTQGAWPLLSMPWLPPTSTHGCAPIPTPSFCPSGDIEVGVSRGSQPWCLHPRPMGLGRGGTPSPSPPAPMALRRRRSDACQIRFQHPGSSPSRERQESPARGRLLQLAWSCTAGTGEPAGTAGMEHGGSPQLPGRPPCPGCLPGRGIPISPAQQLPLAARIPSIPSSQRG